MKNPNRFVKLLCVFLISIIIYSGNSKAAPKNIEFSLSSKNYYSSNEEVQIYLYSYNYDENKKKETYNFYFQIYKIKNIYEFYSKQTSKYSLDVLGSDSTNLLYYTEEVASFNKKIKSTYEYGYFYVNETIPIRIKEKGAYLVRVSAGEKLAYCGFIISDMMIISKAGFNAMLAYIVDKSNDQPVSDALLQFYIGNNRIGEGLSKDGMLYIPVDYKSVNITEQNINPVIIGQKNEDVIISDPYFYFGYSKDKYCIYTYTNQPVYRTESDVLFKSIIKKRNDYDYSSYSNGNVTVIIKDPKGTEVYKNNFKTNENGSIDAKYRIEQNASLGTYSIIVSVNESNTYTSTFTVEQYKKPEYKVIVTTDKKQYYGKDNLTATVKADYFFGSPVQDADVEYEIYRMRHHTPWWKFSEYAWWYEEYYSTYENEYEKKNSELIYSGKGKLDKNGDFQFDYKIEQTFDGNNNYYYWWYYDSYSDYKYYIQAKVVDKSRRQIAGSSTVMVTRGKFQMNSHTDKYFYNYGEKVNIEVRAFDFADSPVKTDFTADIYRISWHKYNNDVKDFITTLTGKTNESGLGNVSYAIPEDNFNGYYKVIVKANDERGNEIKTKTSFYVGDGQYWYGVNESGQLQIITDKDSYKTGDICKVFIVAENPDINVLITAETDNILYHDVVKLNGKTKFVEIPVTANFNSNFKIYACYVHQSSFIYNSKNLLYIPEEKFLTVEIETNQNIYKPKDEGLVKVKVVDFKGNPVKNAEVSLGIIDESIYYIKEDNTKDIRKYFYGNQTASVITSYDYYNYNYGYSRNLNIFEKFNIKNLKESELATIKGTLFDKDSKPIAGAPLYIDEEYFATTTDDSGSFEFKLPNGSYSINIVNVENEIETVGKIKVNKGELKICNFYAQSEVNQYANQKIYTTSELGDLEFKGGMISQPTKAPMEKKSANKKDYSKVKIDETEILGIDDIVQPELRSEFVDAMQWTPYVNTDENGYAFVNVKFPDNLTSWKISSKVITNDTKVGQNAKVVITRKNLLVRMETPRVFVQNDEVIISSIIHNYLDKDKDAVIKFRTDNLELIGDSTFKINLKSNSENRIDWKVKVNNPAGIGKITCQALTNEESDAVEMKVPVQPSGIQLNQNLVTDITNDTTSEIKYLNLPEEIDIRTASLVLNTSPSIASAILLSLDELAGYPYGCVEQTMSRFLPTIVVARTFKDLKTGLKEKTMAELPKMVTAGLNRLYSFQHSDGGWGWWSNDQTNPFMTAYVIYGLTIAKDAGYDVKKDVINKGLSALKNKINENLDATTKSYILYTLSVAGYKDKSFFSKAIDNIKNTELNDYSRSLIALCLNEIDLKNDAMVYIKELEQNIKSSSDGYAYWEGKSWHYNWQDDKIQTTAFGLKALINVSPNSENIDKALRWLMVQRKGFSWYNTQQTAMIVYAVTDYLKISNELNPDYNVKIYVNGKQYIEKNYTKDDVFQKDSVIKIIGGNLKKGPNEIRIIKNGKGKLYFSSNLRFYINETLVKAEENGFRVEREYFKLEKYELYANKQIIYKKKHFDGEVNSGDLLLVKIKVFSKDNDLSYFMLEDPIPGGCEVIKDDWQYRIEDESEYSGYNYYYWRWWYADKEIRDDKCSFFATQLYGNSFQFSYIIRAYIPGNYSVNPSKGELMYYTDYFGNTLCSKFKINDTE
jgi:uncharacterized protein YfaS (alpha-2-macroglobulin family)